MVAGGSNGKKTEKKQGGKGEKKEKKRRGGVITMESIGVSAFNFAGLNWFSEGVCSRYTGSIMYVNRLHN